LKLRHCSLSRFDLRIPVGMAELLRQLSLDQPRLGEFVQGLLFFGDLTTFVSKLVGLAETTGSGEGEAVFTQGERVFETQEVSEASGPASYFEGSPQELLGMSWLS
jgi:hypothetical protein